MSHTGGQKATEADDTVEITSRHADVTLIHQET